MVKKMNFIQRVGEKLREVRKKSGLSLQKLASKSGVSAGTIYKIETGKLVPSIAIFIKIVKGLNKNTSFFLDEENNFGEICFVKSEDRKISHFSRFSIGSIPPGIINAQMGGNIFYIQPDGESGKTSLTHPGEEIIYIIDGMIEMKIRDETFILKKGDSIQFHCQIPHRWRNLKGKVTKAIQICTPPVPV
jgi:DNA-binding XRE family transcriptional regulator/mannose-6-phosphate isomerase-like protein (cupin superfamily)